MVRTGFNTQLEHMADWSPIAQKPVVLGVYADVLELGQMYIPGRHAALLD